MEPCGIFSETSIDRRKSCSADLLAGVFWALIPRVVNATARSHRVAIVGGFFVAPASGPIQQADALIRECVRFGPLPTQLKNVGQVDKYLALDA